MIGTVDGTRFRFGLIGLLSSRFRAFRREP
jgi:hypothetical protein